MKMVICVAVILLAILTSGVLAYCQGDPLVGDIKTVDGTVISVSENSPNSRIVVKAAEAMTFYVPIGAKLVNADGFAIQISDVSSGNYVTIDYYDDKSGNHIMKGMEVEYNK